MANVSVATVSLVLNDKPSRISPATRDKIKKIAEEQHYVPNVAARGLVGSSTNTIGVIISDLGEPINAATTRALSELISRTPYDLVLYETFVDWRQGLYNKIGREGRVDGIIHKAFDLKPEDKDFVKSIGVPVVIYENDMDWIDCVALDNDNACSMAIKYLLRKGHEHIGVISCRQDSDTMNLRLAAICRSLAEAGKSLRDEQIYFVDRFTPEHGKLAADYFHNLADKPTAIFSIAGDYVATGFVTKIQQLGYHVPDDFAVVGFDDLWFSSYVQPKLTTLRQPLEQMTKAAIELLLQRFEQPDKSFETRTFKPELVIRDSA